MRIQQLGMCLLAGLFFLPIVNFAATEEKPAMAANPAVQANNDFACDLYRKLDEENQGKNVFFSPYSISIALAMTMEGARGTTAQEMGQVLRLPTSLRRPTEAQRPWETGSYHLAFSLLNRRLNEPKDSAKDQAIREEAAELRQKLDRVNAQIKILERQSNFRELNALLTQARKLADELNTVQKQVDQYELKVANALWGEKTYPFAQDYLATIDKYYGSGHLRQADFRNNFEAERTKINNWVEEQTRNRIKDLVPEFPPPLARLVRLILVNAIYFKGQWDTPFDEKQTKQENFLLADGGKSLAPMMNALDLKRARYAAFNGDGTFFPTPLRIGFKEKEQTYPERDGFLMVELPVKGDKLAMVVIAPQKADGLPDLEKRLTGENLSAWTGKLQKRVVNVAMPKFKLETNYALAESLQKMGMKQAFLERIADFTGMSTSPDPDDRLYISKVLHKAFVEVNEQGAEAAAATAVIMVGTTSAPSSVPFNPNFRADRPFVFLIRDLESGAILFLGRVRQPG